MIEIKLPTGAKTATNPAGWPAFALRTPAGVWKYLNQTKQADGAATVPLGESLIAEALYQQFTAPAAAGRVLGLPDGSLFTSLGDGAWTLHNHSQGRAIAHLSEYEAAYITDLAVALGTDVLLANATELEHRLREVQSVAAARADDIVVRRGQIAQQTEMLNVLAARVESSNEIIEDYAAERTAPPLAWAYGFATGLAAGVALLGGLLCGAGAI